LLKNSGLVSIYNSFSYYFIFHYLLLFKLTNNKYWTQKVLGREGKGGGK